MSLKLYYDLLSQPARSLYILLKISKIPFQSCDVPLRKGVHMSDEYKRNVSKFGKVPVLHDGDFRLTESVAILRYLSNTHNLDSKWYPKDFKLQARVDEYMEWQHHNTRAKCALYFILKFVSPLLTGKQPPEGKVKRYEQEMNNCLDQVEELWLTPGPYICGDKITAADIWAATEIEQPRICGFDPTENRPKLGTWLNRVREELNPAYDEAHARLNKLAATAMSNKQAKL